MSTRRLRTSSINQNLEDANRATSGRKLGSDHSRDLAIIGISCRFPGAVDMAAYWNNLEAGVNSITEIPGDRWDIAAHYSPDPNAPGKSISKWGGFISDFDKFDNQAFGISDREAHYMDPQQRVLLETAWHAIEDGALDPALLRKRPTGVFVGVMAMDYYQTSFAVPTESYSAIGSYGGILANRISYHWGLGGASVAMDTACASSLVALHEARRAILAGELDYGVVGAVSLNFHPWKYISFSKSRMLSPDGQCKTFDKNANGYVPGEGVAAIVVCPVSLALERGHRIYGVVKGTAVGHTGASSGITAPRVEAQMEVIHNALAEARVPADSISYVEAHGTGTSLGDPIEIEALTRAFRAQTGKTGFCRIGSVKTNIGHLEAVAGMAGLIKLCLMFKHGTIPRHLNLKEVNPIIDFGASPFRVADETMPWDPATHPLRRAGLSSFGFGGVNSHAIFEEPDPAWAGRTKPAKSKGPLILAHSAVTKTSLRVQSDALAAVFQPKSWGEDGLRLGGDLLRSRTHLPVRWGKLVTETNAPVDFDSVPQAKPPRILFLEGLPPESVFDDAPGLRLEREGLLQTWREAGMDLTGSLEELSRGVALLKFLGDRVHPVPAVGGDGKGFLAALLYTGVLTPKDFTGEKTPKFDGKTLGVRRPLRPLAHGGGILDPLKADAAYIEGLVKGFAPSGEAVSRYRHQARQLLESQFTFKKLLADWSKDLAGRGIDLDALLADGALPDVEKAILIGVIRSSLVRLNRKWNLSEKDFRDPVALEFATLLSADLLARRDFLDLLGRSVDAADVATRVTEALSKSGPVPLPVLLGKAEPFTAWASVTKKQEPPQGARLLPGGSAAGKVFLETCLDYWLAGQMASLADVVGTSSIAPATWPAYPFDRRRFWLDARDAATGLAPATQTPVAVLPSPRNNGADTFTDAGPMTWNRTFNSARDGIVGDHRIAGVLLVPGAAMIEMGLRAGDRSGLSSAALTDLQITAPGVVVDRLDLQVSRAQDGFKVTANGKVLTQGKYSQTFSEMPMAMPASLRALSKQDNQPIYTEFSDLGYAYGPTLQVIQDVRSDSEGVGTRLESPAGLEAGSRLNAALLDGLFQMVLLAMGRTAFTPGTLYVPFGLSRISIWRPLEGSVVAYLPRASLRRTDRETRCDLYCWTADGQPILAVHDMVFRQAPKGIFAALLPKPSVIATPEPLPTDLFFVGSSFVPKPIPASGHPHGQWILLGDGSPFSDSLAKSLPAGTIRSPEPRPSDEPGFDAWATQLGGALAQGPKRPLHLVVPFADDDGFTDGGTLGRLGQGQTYVLFELLKVLAKKLHSQEVHLLVLKHMAEPGKTAGLASGGMASLCRTAMLENRKLRARVIESSPVTGLLTQVPSEMHHLGQAPSGSETEVRYHRGERQVRENHRTVPAPSTPFRKDGVYLIAGGAGGIGLRFCEYLAGKVKAVGLVGRSALPAEKKSLLDGLSAKGTRFSYERADLTDAASLAMAVGRLRTDLGPIHGVFHSGGHLEDGLLLKKSREAFSKVYDPKVLGAWGLHEATLGDPLDIFCVFSSIVSVMGNMGQADYAAANGFLDGFARWRQASGFPGKTQSVNWTLWQDGGMGQTDAVLKQLSSIGIKPLHSRHALPAYEAMAGSAMDQGVIVQGDLDKLTVLLKIGSAPNPQIEAIPESRSNMKIPSDTTNGHDATRAKVVEILSSTLGTPADRLEADRNITEYGADSVLVMELADKLATVFGDQVHHQTILDHPTVNDLTAHLMSLGVGIIASVPSKPVSETAPKAPIPLPTFTTPVSVASVVPVEQKPVPAPAGLPPATVIDRRIAVIGMAGRFPESPTLEAFWDNLRAGRDLITEVPQSRFDINPWLNNNIPGQSTYTKRAGVLKDIEYFDNGHFRIKDEDARLLDPQQRLFLEVVQECLDRAGYYAKDIAGTQTAVFVGAGETEYARRPDEKITKYEGKNGVVNTITNLIASRVSDFWDLRGPSWTVHTACSSSLIAVHNACQSILTGESEMALAGGTELFLEESFFIGFSNSKVLSPDAKCHTFDKKANGFAMGEGVGVVLLKPYAKAVADGDRIHGVILATAANNDGKTMGLTTPNIHAQKQVIQKALDMGQVNPDSITYFEAHGTGTYLGDPIEVKAASEVYRKYTPAENYCAIGSVKTNMGHSLMASGAMSLIKVLLCLRERTLVPTLHCEEPHPGIGFGHLPFYLNTQTKSWEPRHGTRRAAISSFGFGGTNAHVILEQAPEGYKSQRETLPPRQWNRKRHWVDGAHRHEAHVYLNPAGRLGVEVSAAPAVAEKTTMASPLPSPARTVSTPSQAATPVALPAPKPTTTVSAGDLSSIRRYLTEKVSTTLKVPPSSVGPDQSFLEMGLDSMTVMELTNGIQDEKQIELYPTLLFEYTTISDLAAYLHDKYPGVFGSAPAPANAGTREAIRVPAAIPKQGLPTPQPGGTLHYVKLKVAATLKVDPSTIGDQASFLEMGLDSMTVMELTNGIQDEKQIELYPTLLFEYTTPRDLAAYLDEKFPGTFSGPLTKAPAIVQEAHVPPRGPSVAGQTKSNLDTVKSYLRKRLAVTLKVGEETINDSASFLEMGLDSMTVMELTNGIQDDKQIELYPTLLFEYTTVGDLAKYLLEKFPNHFGPEDPDGGPGGGPGSNVPPVSPTPPAPVSRPVPGSLPSPARPNIQQVPSPNQVSPATVSVKDADTMPSQTSPHDIAVVGMAGKFPQSENLEMFWKHLTHGENLIREVPPERWDWKKFYGDPVTEPNKSNCRHGGFVDGIDQFDPLFFGISPREAYYMDPQQRLFIEAVWEALEDAGQRPSQLAGRKVGLFAGVSTFDYAFQLDPGMEHVDASIGTGVAHSTLVNRISYLLDIRGPSESVDTACSSALVALHNAIRAITSGDCEMAIAGGVNISSSPMKYITFSRAGMLSEDGQCKTFDKDANGYVPGEGVGAVILKPLAQALSDGDRIHAVIKGTAVNHGGHANSLTSPNPVSQAEVIRAALAKAHVGADTISYVEAHGTGTKLGDPIEINGLRRAFSPDTRREGTCLVGSVKTNIGHLEAAAGMAGLLKVIMALKHRTIPATLNFKTINPFLELKGSPFVIASQRQPWGDPTDEHGKKIPRRAGVSSFGFGGTNAHVIVEEAPAPLYATEPKGHPLESIFLISAKYPGGIPRLCEAFLDRVHADPDLNIPDAAIMTQLGRDAFEHRFGFVAENRMELVSMLERGMRGESGPGSHSGISQGNGEPFPENLVPSMDRSQAPHMDPAYRRYQAEQVLGYWVQGTEVPWDKFHGARHFRKVSLPHYPFDRKRYWITDVVQKSGAAVPVATQATLREAQGEPKTHVAVEATGRKVEAPGTSTRVPRLEDVETLLREKSAEALYIPTEQIDLEKKFVDLGLDSILAVEIMAGVNKAFAIKLPATKLYDYPTIRDLSQYIVENYAEIRNTDSTPGNGSPVNPSSGKVDIEPVLPAVHRPVLDGIPPTKPGPLEKAPPAPSTDEITRVLSREIAGVLYMKPEEIDPEKSFIDLGLDSILAVEIVGSVNKALGIKIPATKVYDYPNINLLSGFVSTLMTEPAEGSVSMNSQVATLGTDSTQVLEPTPVIPKIPAKNLTTGSIPILSKPIIGNGDIAVIGMAGQFPGAPDLNAYWEVLKEGRCTVKEVPKERWDIQSHYDPDPKKPGKTYCKHLGALDHADEFDSLFFEISPKEAELMDPQQRLFLRTAWEVLENAGYANKDRIGKKKVGVYVGVMNHDYAELLARRTDLPPDAYEMMGNSGSILAARISYILDLKGPSLTVDTACSSSLVASHLAIQSLLSGECEMALAGGVTLYLSEKLYILMSKAGMLSPTGRCHTFDNQADGFVPAEGVGAVLLKPLEKALADGDIIHAVIKGSGVNQDGRTNGITAPSALSQTELETSVYAKSGMNPDTFGLMEAHGTGTKLGDPIEVSALTDSWRSFTHRKNFCALGSAKSNLGHTSAAAGMASLMKVILSMKHGVIPPSVLFQSPNEHIDLGASPFYVPQKALPWPAPKESPRRAALSAFGFSGTNAHFVVEEAPPNVGVASKLPAPYLAVLSARRSDGLHEGVKRLQGVLHDNPNIDPSSISHLLLTGRQHFNRRISFLYRTVEDLRSQLGKISSIAEMNADHGIPYYYPGNINHKASPLTVEAARKLLTQAKVSRSRPDSYESSLHEIAELFAKGQNFPFDSLFEGLHIQRVELPTYAFDRGRYWLPPALEVPKKHSEAPHPLLDGLKASLDGTIFHKVLGPRDWILSEHQVAKEKILPGAAMAEMARAAISQASDRTVSRLHKLEFMAPIKGTSQEVSISIRVGRSESGAEFKISSLVQGQEVTHARGKADWADLGKHRRMEITRIESRLVVKGSMDDFYEGFERRGIAYGPSFRPIRKIFGSSEESLGHLTLAGNLKPMDTRWVLHPALLDGSLQVVAGMDQGEDGTFVPVTLGTITIFGALKEDLRVHAVKVSEHGSRKRFNLEIADADGNILVSIEDFILQKIGVPRQSSPAVLFEPGWNTISDVKSETVESPIWVLSVDSALSTELQNNSIPHRWFQLHHGFHNEDWGGLDPAAWARCFVSLHGRNLLPRAIFMKVPTMDAGLETRLDYGPRLLFAMAKGWIDANLKNQARILVMGEDADPSVASCAGFARSVAQESTRLDIRVIRSDRSSGLGQFQSGNSIPLKWNPFRELRNSGAKWEARGYVKSVPSEIPSLPGNQTVLITGGTGGLGLVIARAFLADPTNRVALVGRKSLHPRSDLLAQEFGDRLLYLKADVSRLEDVTHLLNTVKAKWSAASLIIHGAGTLKDGLLGKKSLNDFESVISPKIMAIENFSKVAADIPLVAMSSVASVTGNVGQTDYACGNAWMDRLVENNPLWTSVNWGLWENGGMTTDDAQRRLMARAGLSLIEDGVGIAVLSHTVRNNRRVVMVAGKEESISKLLHTDGAVPSTNGTNIQGVNVSVKSRVVEALQLEVAQLLKVPAGEIDSNTNLSEYGVDSVMAMMLKDQVALNLLRPEVAEDLQVSVFMEHPNLDSLSEYLLERDFIQVRFLSKPFVTPQESPAVADPVAVLPPTKIDDSRTAQRVQAALRSILSQLLKVSEGDLDAQTEISQFGVDSVMAMMLKDLLTGSLLRDGSEELQVAAIMENPTIQTLGRYLHDQNLIDESKLDIFERTGLLTVGENRTSPGPAQVSATGDSPSVPPENRLIVELQARASSVLGLVPLCDPRKDFHELGFDHVGLQMFLDLICGELKDPGFQKPVYVSLLLEAGNIENLSKLLLQKGICR